LTVGLVEAMYFINLLFMVVFVYVFAKKQVVLSPDAIDGGTDRCSLIKEGH
jgi:hypothetical protein